MNAFTDGNKLPVFSDEDLKRLKEDLEKSDKTIHYLKRKHSYSSSKIKNESK